MRILLHICCAPCATYPFEVLKEEGHRVDGYFYNPNIQPFREYLRRREAVEEYAEQSGNRVIISPKYDFKEFLRDVVYREDNRCRYCYYRRLRTAAAVARKGKYEAFTTTLLISKEQNHDLARQVGADVAEETGVEFYYRDFREGWKKHWELTEEYGFYK